jgi:hypothetical protein
VVAVADVPVFVEGFVIFATWLDFARVPILGVRKNCVNAGAVQVQVDTQWLAREKYVSTQTLLSIDTLGHAIVLRLGSPTFGFSKQIFVR